MTSEIRKHYFLRRYVVIAPGRAKRPLEVRHPRLVKHDRECHFCRGNEDPAFPEHLRLPETGPWQVRVIGNKFPAFTPDNPKAYGYQEIIIETPEHNKQLGDFSDPEWQQLIEVYTNRVTALEGIPHIRYVLLFKNEGEGSGASINHAHSQIFATHLVPPEITLEEHHEDAFRERHHHCLYCEILHREEHSPRLIWQDRHFIAIAPYASRLPYEAWVLPRAHHRSLRDLSAPERLSLAHALRLLLGRLERAGVGYNFYIHSARAEERHHLHIEITPRPNIWGGYELGSGVMINPVAPESVSEFYAL